MPCGTPESTGTSFEDLPSNTTLIERPIKKCSSHLSVVPAIVLEFVKEFPVGDCIECLAEIQYCHVYLRSRVE